jgi:hypothetical protein
MGGIAECLRGQALFRVFSWCRLRYAYGRVYSSFGFQMSFFVIVVVIVIVIVIVCSIISIMKKICFQAGQVVEESFSHHSTIPSFQVSSFHFRGSAGYARVIANITAMQSPQIRKR